MKKTYVKPMAAGVAFVVNENVATSLGNDTNVVSGFKLYQQIDGCNTHFFATDVLTGFESKGEEATTMIDLSKIGDYNEITLSQLLDIVTTPSDPRNPTFRACFLG